MNLNTELITSRLILEPLTANHADLLFTFLQSEAIYKWISSTPPASIQSLKEHWKRNESRVSPDGNSVWLAWAVRQISDGKYLGKCDAEINKENEATNVGYLLFPEFWGQGYATETVVALALHLDKNGIKKQRATVTDGNTASFRVLEKAGFIRGLTLKGNDTIRGVKYDDIEYIRK